MRTPSCSGSRYPAVAVQAALVGRRCIAHDHESGQVAVERAQTVTAPGTQAGLRTVAQRPAGVELENRRMLVSVVHIERITARSSRSRPRVPTSR